MHIRLISSALMGYLLLASMWWAYLLLRENDALYRADYQLLQLRTPIAQPADWAELDAKHHRKRRMIVLEGIVLTAFLAGGLWLVRRSVRKEVDLAQQRRNFMLSITHELKSPIAALRLAFETMQRRTLTQPQIERLCGQGLGDALRLQTLVDDLLLGARLEQGWKPYPEPVDIGTTVRQIMESLRLRFPKANLVVDVPADLPSMSVDKSGLTAIVQNLLENAIKYSPEGSPVVLRAEQMPQALCIEVADAGQGIPASERSAIFEKFYRLGNEETRQTTGTGLGLYIVRAVATAHRGQVVVRDNEPQGTIFSVTLRTAAA